MSPRRRAEGDRCVGEREAGAGGASSSDRFLRAAPALLAGVLACTQPSDAPLAQVVDSAGIHVVTYDLARGSVPLLAVVDEPEVEVGTAEGAPEYVLSRVADVATAADGSLVVSDAQTRELRVFEAGGIHRATLGQAGQGPGEFGAPPIIAGVAGDTVWAYDPTSSRITAYTLDGELVTVRTVHGGETRPPTSLARLADGSFLATVRWSAPGAPGAEPHDPREELDSIALLRLHASAPVPDTLRVIPDRARLRAVMDGGGGRLRTMETVTPWAPRAFVRTDGHRIVLARSDAFQVEIVDAEGRATIVRVRGVDHPASAEQIRAHQEDLLRREWGGAPIDPIVRMVNLDHLPDRLPSFADLLIARNGDVWVAAMEYDASRGYDWLVLSPEGRLRGSVRTPPGFRAFAVDDAALVGVYSDELDVPYVRRYALRPPPRKP